MPGERGEMPKSGQSGHRSAGPGGPSSPKPHNSRWMEKLKMESIKSKTLKEATLQLNLLKEGSIKTISTGKKSKATLKQEQPKAKKTISTAKKSKATLKQEQEQKQKPKAEKLKSTRPAFAAREVYSKEAELVEVDELDQQVNQRVSASEEKLLEDNQGNRYEEGQLSLRCYLQACVFVGDIDRAQRCLNYHHQNLSRRKLLSMSAYNIMLKVWAKKVSSS